MHLPTSVVFRHHDTVGDTVRGYTPGWSCRKGLRTAQSSAARQRVRKSATPHGITSRRRFDHCSLPDHRSEHDRKGYLSPPDLVAISSPGARETARTEKTGHEHRQKPPHRSKTNPSDPPQASPSPFFLYLCIVLIDPSRQSGYSFRITPEPSGASLYTIPQSR